MQVYYARKHVQYFNLLITIFGIILLLAYSADSISCYVCNLEENQSSCDNLNPSNKESFAKECPSDSRGCSTQIKGNKIIHMSCESFLLNDCESANEIEYCYCTTNFCNGKKSVKKSISITSNIGLIDDEDFNEGSGFHKIFSSTELPISTIQPLNTADCLHGTFIVIAAVTLLP